MAAGTPLLYFDFKQRAGLAVELASTAQRCGAKFQRIDSSTISGMGYNPLHVGEVESLAERLERVLPGASCQKDVVDHNNWTKSMIALDGVISGLQDRGESGLIPRILEILQSLDHLQVFANCDDLQTNTKTRLSIVLDQYRAGTNGGTG
jgi:hypothetical protein